MKKLLFSLVVVGLVTLMSGRSFAQAKLDWGARIGANISDFSISKTSDAAAFSSQVGILGGLQMDYWFNPKLAFCGQLLFLQRGGKEVLATTDQSGQTTSATESVKSNYFEIPLEAKYQFGDDAAIRPYVFAGPTIGLLLSATGTSTINGQSTAGTDIKSQFASTNFGLIGGLGLNLAVNEDMTLFVEAAYAYGFADVYQDTQPTSANTRDIQISAGITFH